MFGLNRIHGSRNMGGMSDPLTPDEWALLHRAMDRVDRQRQVLPVPNEEKIRASALATYRHQGVDVSEQELDQAVKETLAQWRRSQAPAGASLALDLPSVPSQLLWRWSQAWQVVPADENLLGVRPASIRHGNSSMRRWHGSFLPYCHHVPQSDQALGDRLVGAAKFQMGRWKNSVWGSWGLSALSLVVGSGIVLLGGGFGGVLFAAVNSYFSIRLILRSVDAQAKLALIGQALEDLKGQRWDTLEIKRALQGTGLLVHGSLRPLSTDAPRWQALGAKAKGFPEAKARWAEWGASEHLRENDGAVLEKTIALLDQHPTRQIFRSALAKTKKALAPLFWGSR